MNVGLPGSGIGGLFYVLAALLMPLHELCMLAAGKSSWARWRLVSEHFAIAVGILAGIWAMGWALAQGLSALQQAHALPAGALEATRNLVRVRPFALAVSILGVVLISVQIASLFIRAPEAQPAR